MNDTPETDPVDEPANLKFLRLLVTVLTGTMIAGLLVILTLIVIRYTDRRTPLPEVITLPDGAMAATFTYGPDWYAVVTTDDRILIFNRETGKLAQTIQIKP
ncbi:MAG: DUF6476 family protein [Rhodobacteraceae bacterium]|nr:DUF6476 family protein [Paracoccaceae bacterium]